VDDEGRLAAVLTRSQMMAAAKEQDPGRPLREDGSLEPKSISPAHTLRQAAAMMAESKLTAFPVLDETRKLAGILTITDLLTGRMKESQRESDRVRILRVRWPFSGREQQDGDATVAAPAGVPVEKDQAVATPKSSDISAWRKPRPGL
jgi:hypothetical protein